MLGALHEESIHNNMRLSGEELNNARQRFALEQGSRAYLYLCRRNASQDPAFRETLLLCCLLFVLADLIWARYDSALQHLRGGLQILKEMTEVQTIDRALLENFERLDIQSSHFGMLKPFLKSIDQRWEHWHSPSPMSTLGSVQDVRHNVNNLLNMGIPFLANCWALSQAEIAAKYGELWHRQHSLLSIFKDLQQSINNFRNEYDKQINNRERQALDLSELQCLGQILSLKTCLMDGLAPVSMISEFEALLSASQQFISQLSNRPTISLTYGVNANLYVVASRCPQLFIQLEAINTLLSWPHCEGFINSNMAASLALATVKMELEHTNQLMKPLCDEQTEQELNQFLRELMRLTEHAECWPLMRAAKFPQPRLKTGGQA